MNVPKEPIQDSNHLLIESHLIEISAEFVHTYQDCKKREISSKKRVSSYADGPFCKLLKIISVVIIRYYKFTSHYAWIIKYVSHANWFYSSKKIITREEKDHLSASMKLFAPILWLLCNNFYSQNYENI